MRFHGGGTAWNHVAMDQAIRDAGLEDGDVSNERTGIIMGSGGPSTRAIVEAADVTRAKGPKRVGPFAVPKAMASTASATLATWFKIKGVNYSISSACATSNHCIGNAYEMIQYGKQDVIFAGGSEELDWTLSVLFDAMGADVDEVQRHPATASRAYDVNRDGFVIAGGAGRRGPGGARARQGRAAPASTARWWATAPPPTATTWWRLRARARCAACAWRCDREGPDRLHQPARHRDAGRRSEGDRGDPRGVRLGDKCPPIAATKSLTGHSLGATGVQEAIYSLLMMNNRFICESAHIEEIDPAVADMNIVRERSTTPRSTRCSPTPSASAAPTPPWS
jgi:3-oxoacyl-[acyl-carrier-protein] synthase-1